MTEQEKRKLFPSQDIHRYLDNRLGESWRTDLKPLEIISLVKDARDEMIARLPPTPDRSRG